MSEDLTARLAAAGTTGTAEFITHRFICGKSSGRFGSVTISTDDDPNIGRHLDIAEDVLGAMLGEGGRLRITIEVLEAGTLRENRWDPPLRVGDGTWAAYEAYCGRSPITFRHTDGSATQGSALRDITVAGDDVLLHLTQGYGSLTINAATVTGATVRTGDTSTVAMLTEALPALPIEEA